MARFGLLGGGPIITAHFFFFPPLRLRTHAIAVIVLHTGVGQCPIKLMKYTRIIISIQLNGLKIDRGSFVGRQRSDPHGHVLLL